MKKAHIKNKWHFVVGVIYILACLLFTKMYYSVDVAIVLVATTIGGMICTLFLQSGIKGDEKEVIVLLDDKS